ncbi:hypothetical protein [Streptomyces graminilatus]|uniref:hypothetical protein n=1 Tax=Streptomyces graminilatus TaxID=1464070 RepID=UPI0012FF17F0|nr:hypothetical protein [Streptomyces graminilatus]
MPSFRRLLDRVRTLLLGLPEPCCPTPEGNQTSGSTTIAHNPSPEMWGAILIHARRRRVQRQGLVPTPTRFIEPGPAMPVRAYAYPPNGQARVLALSAREAR